MTATTTEKVAPRLKARYQSEIKGQLQDEFTFANVMQVPTEIGNAPCSEASAGGNAQWCVHQAGKAS